MIDKNILNLTKKESNNLYILGFYSPRDYYLAHLLEHLLAVDLGKRNLLKIDHANCGAGYIFIDGTVQDASKLKSALKNLASFGMDFNSLYHQKIIVITENLYRTRLNLDRDVYESLETNSSSQLEKDKLFDDFLSCEGEELNKKISSIFHNIRWIIFDEDYNLLDIKNALMQLPKNKENIFKYIFDKPTDNFVFAEIDIATPSSSKIYDIILYVLNKNIYNETQDTTILFGTHNIYNALSKTWNKRSIAHYSGYFPKVYANDFYDFVIEKWKNIKLDSEDKTVIVKLINKYIRNRSIDETIMELAEYHCLVETDWADKFDLDTVVSKIVSALNVYKRVENIRQDKY